MAVLTANTKRETGKKAQSGNIMAAKVNLAPSSGRFLIQLCQSARQWCKYIQMDISGETVRLLQAVSDIVRTTLGPRAMLKMLLDSSGGRLRAFHDLAA